MFLKIAVVIAIAIVIVVAFAATKPKTFRIQRSITTEATPEQIFPLINDLHSWSKWSEQGKGDSSMKTSYSGPQSGKGAGMQWSGTGSTGTASMVILESVQPQKILIQVDWVKPFSARNINDFVLEPEGNSTRVTWTMQGPNLFIMRLMGVFVNMDRMMGKHFEASLANLKTVAEEKTN